MYDFKELGDGVLSFISWKTNAKNDTTWNDANAMAIDNLHIGRYKDYATLTTSGNTATVTVHNHMTRYTTNYRIIVATYDASGMVTGLQSSPIYSVSENATDTKSFTTTLTGTTRKVFVWGYDDATGGELLTPVVSAKTF